ncbi:unnamed protein product [Lampetra fluviatilis]
MRNGPRAQGIKHATRRACSHALTGTRAPIIHHCAGRARKTDEWETLERACRGKGETNLGRQQFDPLRDAVMKDQFASAGLLDSVLSDRILFPEIAPPPTVTFGRNLPGENRQRAIVAT